MFVKEFEEQMVEAVHTIGVVVLNAVLLFASREERDGRVASNGLSFNFVRCHVDLGEDQVGNISDLLL